MHLATKIYDLIIEKNKGLLDWSKEDVQMHRQILRLSALLHDTGHAPFSHAAEHLFPEGAQHEDYTTQVITNSEVTPIVEKIGRTYGFTPGVVAGLITGRHLPHQRLLKDIVASELDADKMDYLLRDSLHAGVEYGRYDLERVLETMNIYSYQNRIWELAVEEDGVHALEGLVLARYFMFVQVYLHRTRRMYDHILSEFLRTALPDGVYPHKLTEFLEWDDFRVIELAKSCMAENTWADRLVNRRHFKVIADLSPHVNEDQEVLSEIRRTLEAQYGKDQLFIDEYKKRPIKFRDPDDQPTICLIGEQNERSYPIDERSIVIRNFGVPIHLYRVYADPEIASEVKAIFNKKARHMQGGRRQ